VTQWFTDHTSSGISKKTDFYRGVLSAVIDLAFAALFFVFGEQFAGGGWVRIACVCVDVGMDGRRLFDVGLNGGES
jgi:hypothetical protein